MENSFSLSKPVVLGLMLIVSMMMFISSVKCDTDKDKEKCANDLVGLATCLPYVSGEAKTAPVDCCTGLKQVLQKSPECMCLLIKDRDDPSLGLKINATLAMNLPSQCHAPANISECPALLHLAPNSPDAKVFEDFANIGKTTSNTSAAAPTPAENSPSVISSSTNNSNDGGISSSRSKMSCWSVGLVILFAMSFIGGSRI